MTSTTVTGTGVDDPDYDYVAIGHVARDELPDGTARAGGSALYSALQAARLGLRALIVTQGRVAEIEALVEPWRNELAVRVAPAEQTTTLLTRGAGVGRRQRLLAWAGEMVDPQIPNAAILHLAPIARELSAGAKTFGKSDDCVITPQGLLRHWPPRSGEIRLAAPEPALMPARFTAAVISEHELAFCAPLLATARECAACVAITAGERAATLQLGDGRTLAGPIPPTVRVLDDLGAGDVFAAAFFVALNEGRDPVAAAAFAHAAAAIRVGGDGPDAIGRRDRIEALSGLSR